jgi:hypothetical protein
MIGAGQRPAQPEAAGPGGRRDPAAGPFDTPACRASDHDHHDSWAEPHHHSTILS